MPVEFIEGDLPPIVRAGRRRPERKYAAEAEEIRTRPGVWAILRRGFPTPTAASQVARHVMNNQLASFRQRPPEDPNGHYEAKSRTVGDDHRVYVRYLKDEP